MVYYLGNAIADQPQYFVLPRKLHELMHGHFTAIDGGAVELLVSNLFDPEVVVRANSMQVIANLAGTI